MWLLSQSFKVIQSQTFTGWRHLWAPYPDPIQAEVAWVQGGSHPRHPSSSAHVFPRPLTSPTCPSAVLSIHVNSSIEHTTSLIRIHNDTYIMIHTYYNHHICIIMYTSSKRLSRHLQISLTSCVSVSLLVPCPRQPLRSRTEDAAEVANPSFLSHQKLETLKTNDN